MKAKVSHIYPRSLVTPASGFIGSYDFTMNPFVGCTFSCSYCYAADFAGPEKSSWGQWVKVKKNAESLANQTIEDGELNGKTVYMSSVTDPYQPVERTERVTRSALESIIPRNPGMKLAVQTRGTLVTRDIDLFRQLESVVVQMTITCDEESNRRRFEPQCPSIPARLKAVEKLAEAGILVTITFTPAIYFSDMKAFARECMERGASHFIIQPFHLNRRGANTRDRIARMVEETYPQYMREYRRAVSDLSIVYPEYGEGQAGFKPRF